MLVNSVSLFNCCPKKYCNQTGTGLSRQDSNPALRTSKVGFGAKKPKGLWDSFVDGARRVGKRIAKEIKEISEADDIVSEREWNKLSPSERRRIANDNRIRDNFMD